MVTGRHKHVLVALVLVAALTAWYDDHKLLVTVFLTLGMLVKIVTVIPLVLFHWAMIRAESTVRDRVVTLGKHLAVIVALTAVAAIPFGISSRATSAFMTVTSFSNSSMRPPEVIIASASASFLRSHGLAREVTLSNDFLQVAFLGIAAVALLLLPRRSGRPITETILLALLIFLLCSRYLQPWYLAWFVPLVCFVIRGRVVVIALVFTLIAAENVTAKSTRTISTWLTRFSYDVYPLVAIIFIVALFAEAVRRPSWDRVGHIAGPRREAGTGTLAMPRR